MSVEISILDHNAFEDMRYCHSQCKIHTDFAMYISSTPSWAFNFSYNISVGSREMDVGGRVVLPEEVGEA
jgi:hypothetical protein